MTRSTADTVKSATVPLSTSSEHREATIIKTAIGRTEKKDSLNFEKIFLNIRLAYRPLSDGRLMTKLYSYAQRTGALRTQTSSSTGRIVMASTPRFAGFAETAAPGTIFVAVATALSKSITGRLYGTILALAVIVAT